MNLNQGPRVVSLPNQITTGGIDLNPDGPRDQDLRALMPSPIA